jgi:hypothetical protein
MILAGDSLVDRLIDEGGDSERGCVTSCRLALVATLELEAALRCGE